MSVTTGSGPPIDLAPAGHLRGPGMSGTFKAVFFTVVAATLLAAIAAIWLAFFENSAQWTVSEQSIFDTMNSAVKLGLGAILGLIGGRGNADH